MTASTDSYVMIPASEYEMIKSRVVLTESDLSEILEYRDVFIKFIEKIKVDYQLSLAL